MTDLTVRLADPSDAPAVAAIYRPVVLETAISFETAVVTDDEMADRISATLPALPWLVGHRDGAVVGYAHAAPHNVRAAYVWSVNVSVYVAAQARGQGVGRRLYDALLAVLALQGHGSAFAGIALPNPTSVALHESLGFVPVGVHRRAGWKHGRWWDVGWWQLLLPEPAAPRTPALLSTIPDLVDRALSP